MGLSLSIIKNRLPAIMLSLYIFSFWILTQGWNEDNVLDGSWRYAFGKFRELGFSLGRDSWFTYGPLAHWFGAPMGTAQYQPFPYYLFGLFVAGIIGMAFGRILEEIGLSFRLRIVAALFFPFSFIGMDGIQEVNLIVALCLLLISCCLQEKPDNMAVFSMIFLSACGLLYKISLGILSLFALVLLMASLLVRGKTSYKMILLCMIVYASILYALFMVTSGSSDLLTYIRLGLETSGKYSEIMIRNMSFSPQNYIIALVYGAVGSILAWQASRKMAGQWARLCLNAAYLGMLLFLFKHGFVRADLAHMKLFYSSVTPLLAVLAIISWSGFKTKTTLKRVLLWSTSIILFLIYVIMLKILPGETSLLNLAKNWLTCGNRIVAGIRGQGPEEYIAKSAFVRNSKPQLFSRLNDYSRTFAPKGRKPRITFYPWELMFFEGVAGYDLAPSPGLQIYTTGPHSRTHGLEAAFLSAITRPDIVVIGPSTIDDRSPLGELTDLLQPLYSHYRVLDVVEGFTILEASEAGKSPDPVVHCTETPQGMPGNFLRISLEQPEVVNNLLWQLAITLFKAPELDVVVTMTDANNEKTEYVWRGYLSQLKEGVFYSPDSLPLFIGTSFRTSPMLPNQLPRPTTIIKSAVAELRRNDGFWNLPVFPQSVPLKVSYCSMGTMY